MVKNSLLIKIVLSSGFSLILFQFLKWYLVDLITPFLMPILWILVHGCFFIILIFTAIHLIKHKNWKPFLIQLCILIICLLTPFTLIYIKLDFLIYKDEREEIVKLIQDKQLTPNVSYDNNQIHLPSKFTATSKGGGDIHVHYGKKDISVFFYTYRGLTDNFSGFIYSTNDIKPNETDFNSIFKDRKKLEKNWYYVTSY
ncbi:hypothetical protein QCI77_29205 [Bacillus cereus group sp. MG9]|uniref:hypothetical protein n=1 Tax=Bacillus cereus group sp. MG9 TaxID=3040247 RepID=UPI00339759B0